MSDLPGYDYDIFISYAHVDNEPILPAQQGWVDALIRLLSIDLTMKIGRREAFSIWFDEQQLRGNHEINGHISEQVRRSAVFLAVLSPGYVASQACLRELRTFIELVAGDDLERLFVAYKYPLDEDRHLMPEPFGALRKYQFTSLDQRRKARTLALPQPGWDVAGDRQYFQLVDDLACDIADKLGRLRKSGVQSDAPARVLRLAANPQKPVILLAEVTDDLEGRRDEARRYLAQQEIAVLPTGTYRLSREDFARALAADLARCAAFVQLLGPVIGKQPPDVPEGFGRLQYELAQQVLGRRPNLAILQWRSPDLDISTIESAPHRRFLELATVQAVPFEDFKRAIVDTVRPKSIKALKGPNPSFVFINASDVDIEDAHVVRERLGDGLAWAMPLHDPDAKAEEVQEYLEANLKNCDGLVVVYGKARPRWVASQLQLYLKLAADREKDLRVLAIVEAPPEPKAPIPIGLPGLRTVRIADVANVIKPALTR